MLVVVRQEEVEEVCISGLIETGCEEVVDTFTRTFGCAVDAVVGSRACFYQSEATANALFEGRNAFLVECVGFLLVIDVDGQKFLLGRNDLRFVVVRSRANCGRGAQ